MMVCPVFGVFDGHRRWRRVSFNGGRCANHTQQHQQHHKLYVANPWFIPEEAAGRMDAFPEQTREPEC